MTLCELITKPITRMVEEGKNLDQIAEAICPTILHGREKIIRVIRDFLGEEYLVTHSKVLGYDVGKADLARKRKHRAHEKIDAGTDSVVESASVTPTCQTTVQAVNTEHVKEAQAKQVGQAKGQEQEKVLEEPGACCQRPAKAGRKKIALENKDLETKQDAPVENKFDVLVKALKGLIKLSSLEDVKKALAFVESELQPISTNA